MVNMRNFGPHSWALVAAFLALVAAMPCRAMALTPKSPEVQAAIERACAYLATNVDARPGARALVGMTFLKAGQPNHPKVQAGLTAVNEAMKFDLAQHDIYTVGLMIIFMTELPKEQQAPYADAIAKLVDHLKRVQKPHGGWGYPIYETGDTSMMQYGVLGLWSAQAAGYDTPLECWEKAANWLIRTQGPDGTHGYQGIDPGGFTPVAQNRTTMSMCAAGSGCLYMCADYFGLLDEKLGGAAAKADEESPLKRIKNPGTGRRGKETTQVDSGMLWERIGKANGHIDSVFTVNPPEYGLYYLYALERYKTFKDYSEGNIDKEVEWYTEGAKWLLSQQKPDGQWNTSSLGIGPACDTCFATLFLLRSMYKKVQEIKRLAGGLAVGGRGLPSGEGELENRGGTVKQKPLKGPAEKLLEMVGNPLDPNFESAVSGLASQSLASDEDHLTDIQKKLREMMKDGKSPEQRAAAVKLLARTRDLNQVPILLEALKDPDSGVFTAANEGLRFVSRKFAGPAFWGGDDEAIRKEALGFWTKWYKSLNPQIEMDD